MLGGKKAEIPAVQIQSEKWKLNPKIQIETQTHHWKHEK